jgi:hypothetical protein
MIIELLDKLSVWGIFLTLFVFIIMAIEFGLVLGKRKRASLGDEEKPHTGTIVAATLTMLAFMIAVVFSAVESRFDERKHIALEEANAIGTAYLRADLLPEAYRVDIQQLLYDYVSLRFQVTQDGGLEPKLEQAIDRSEVLQGEMWSIAVTLADQQPTPITALFVQSLNELIDTHQARITVGFHYRMQGSIWIMLYSLTILTLIMGGYETGLSARHLGIPFTILAALSFSIVLTLMVSLDQPWQHLSAVTQEALFDVQDSMRRSIQSRN